MGGGIGRQAGRLGICGEDIAPQQNVLGLGFYLGCKAAFSSWFTVPDENYLSSLSAILRRKQKGRECNMKDNMRL